MKKNDEKAIIERIRRLRCQYAGDRGRSKFARALGLSPSTYSYYEDNRVPPIDILLKICEVTSADLQWLLTGEKEPEKPESASEIQILRPEGRETGVMEDSLLRKIDALLHSNPDLATPLTAFVELLLEKRGKEKTLSAEQVPSQQAAVTGPERPGWIPVLGRTAAGLVHFWDQSALPKPAQAVTELDQLVKKYIGREIIGSVYGTVSIDLRAQVLPGSLKTKQANLIQVGGQTNGPAATTAQHDEQIVEFIQCEQVHKLFPDSFALQIDGDSMSPRINDGDIVILSPSVPAAQGHIAVARLANQIGVTCKLIRTADDAVHLIPINEKYETKIVAKKDLLWALAVLCHISI